MFKESYEPTPNITPERMNGEQAERAVLGSQPTEGLVEYFKGEKFKNQVQKISNDLIKEGIVEKMKDYYPPLTDEEWRLTVQEYVRTSFLDTKSMKRDLEGEKNNAHTDQSMSFKGMLNEKISRSVTLNFAIRQMLDISALNKKIDPEKYSEQISTPFSTTLDKNLKTMLKRKYPQSHFTLEYVPAILEDVRSLTYLDGIKAIDAFIVITDSDTGFFRVAFIDFTTNPKKTDRLGMDHGFQVKSAHVMESTRNERKQIVYMDKDNLKVDSYTTKTAHDCAESMMKDIEQAYGMHLQSLTA